MQWRINDYSREYHGVTGRFNVNIYIPRTTPHIISVTDSNCFGHLYITLKIFYEKDDIGSDAEIDRTIFTTGAWPTAAWATYLDSVRRLSRFWDSRFWLVLNESNSHSSEYRNVERFISIAENITPHPVTGGRQLTVRPRTILCRFNLEILESNAGAHKHIRVAYITDNATGTTTGVNTFTNRSNAAYYDNGDVITVTGGFPSISSGYNTVIHELGHAIGIPHIGVETRFDPCLEHDHFWDDEGTNAMECYQGSLTNDIMGTGGELHWYDAIPWRLALERLTSVPHQYYTVHQHPIVSNSLAELISEGTPRWREFHEGTSWW